MRRSIPNTKGYPKSSQFKKCFSPQYSNRLRCRIIDRPYGLRLIASYHAQMSGKSRSSRDVVDSGDERLMTDECVKVHAHLSTENTRN